MTVLYRDLFDMSKDNIQIKESKSQGIILSGVTEVTLLIKVFIMFELLTRTFSSGDNALFLSFVSYMSSSTCFVDMTQ